MRITRLLPRASFTMNANESSEREREPAHDFPPVASRIFMSTASPKLTAMAKAAGCAAKLNPATLDAVLRKLPRQTNPNVLVGFDTNDDAGVYKISETLALVQTVDFFTPIVDDPDLFGQIAAAKALSDVYAMGGTPISSLSIVGFPEKGDPEILEAIIRGG